MVSDCLSLTHKIHTAFDALTVGYLGSSRHSKI